MMNMPVVVFSLVIASVLTFGLVYVLSHRQKVVVADLWDCGYTEVNPRMEITATGFSRSLIVVFKGIFKPTKQHTIEYVDANMRYFSKSRTVTLGIVNIYETHVYYPLHNYMFSLSKQIKKIQGGNINQYLLYIFIVLLGLLIWARY